ncbi:arsenite efflux transporter metallochaperone ArsD [Parendozoicomonas haliclonae]|uniref:Arsenical resistance operon trans-acting repressor ArsD n=1 Tax=Parendozoicomonas haliclonae TaxID=1960125 RepID=A0A1X7ARK6_9GAMM|nr:arsenite efflux transporter metallochaperone ArsD [Parendozoicomonas haliclonae]SMA50720.1 Arsenical resistance operon trans-acting repressor ArsD [Parendozoicomonas haliclonae]
MSVITVFDPAMCCSSGVCGPKPDQKLSVFSADLGHLETLGHQVTRYNLAQEPAAFAANLTVKVLLESHQNEALPVILRDGELVSYGTYPSRDQLIAMAEGAAQEAGSEPKAEQKPACCGCGGAC